MVGERRGVRKDCNTHGAKEQERRRKARMEWATSQPSMVSQPSEEPFQEEPTQEESIQEEPQQDQDIPNSPPPPSSPVGKMATRAIAMGRRVDFDFFESCNFSIRTWIDRMGWRNFCTMDILMYPKLVREFYENLKRGFPEIASTVKGI